MGIKNQQYINNWFQRFEHRMAAETPNIVAETATEFFKERFRTEEWDGVPWQPLSPKYAASKTKGKGRILTLNGILMNSIRPVEVTPNRVVIAGGNQKAPYARVHNEGLRVTGIRKVRPYTNTNFMGKGRKMPIPAHTRSVNYQMPQRQFMGHSRFLNQAIIDRLVNHFNNKK